MTFDKFKCLVPERRGISPDMVPQPCLLHILLWKIETVCVAPMTLQKHHNQTWTAAQMPRECGSWETARMVEVTGTGDADSDGNSPLRCCDAGRTGFTKCARWSSPSHT